MSTHALQDRQSIVQLNDWAQNIVALSVDKVVCGTSPVPLSEEHVELYRYTMANGDVYVEYVQTTCCDLSQNLYLAFQLEDGTPVESSMWWA